MKCEYVSDFIHIVDANGIRNAAKELNTAPSVLSKHISRMEQELGVTLIDGQCRKFTLTEAGKAFFPYAKILYSIQNDILNLGNSNRSASRFLRIGFSSDYLSPYASCAIVEYMNTHPDIHTQIRPIMEENARQAILNGHCDIVMIHHLPSISPPFDFQMFGEDKVTVVFPKGSELSKYNPVPFEALLPYDIYLSSESSRLYSLINALYKDKNCRANFHIFCSEIVNQMVLSQKGITFLPYIRPPNAQMPAFEYRLIDPPVSVTNGFLFSHGSHSNEVYDFLKFISKYQLYKNKVGNPTSTPRSTC